MKTKRGQQDIPFISVRAIILIIVLIILLAGFGYLFLKGQGGVERIRQFFIFWQLIMPSI